MNSWSNKAQQAIRVEDVARLKRRLRVGDKIPCLVVVRNDKKQPGGRNGDNFFKEIVVKLPIKRFYPHLVEVSGMGKYRDTTITYIQLLLLMRGGAGNDKRGSAKDN